MYLNKPFWLSSCSMCMPSHPSFVWLFATVWTVACQAPLSMGFSRQEYWSGLLCPLPGHLPAPRVTPMSPVAPALQAHSLLLSHWRRPSSFQPGVKRKKWDQRSSQFPPFSSIREEGLKVPTQGSRLGCLVTVGVCADHLYLFLPLQLLIAC